MKTPLSNNQSRLCYGLLSLFILLLTACGGGGGGSSQAGNPTTPPPATDTTVEPPVFSVKGIIVDESDTPFVGALVTLDGIEAESLSDAQGEFMVESEFDFDASALVTVAKDGFEPFNQVINVNNTDEANSYQLNSNITMLETQPWGYLEITVTPGGGLAAQDSALIFNKSTTANAQAACDCVMNFSGKASKKGKKKSELYILLVVDASGSTNQILTGTKSVFDIEVEALTAMVNAINEDDDTKVGVLQFATDASVVLDFTTNLSAVKNALASITPQIAGTSGAATNYQAALELTKSTFDAVNLKKHDIKTVAFMSDGIPTAPFDSGNTQEKEDRIAAINAAATLADKNISVNTFPVNINSHLTTLPGISAITEGLYYQHDSSDIVAQLPKDSLVGIIGIEVVNETTAESALNLILYPDGRYEGDICLTADEKNKIKITPAVCESCEKLAYQKINVSCEREECSTCAGQITNLDLMYTGSLNDATITVRQRKNANKSDLIFEDIVPSGEQFSFFGSAKDKTMGPKIEVYINGEINAEFTTSCGQPKIGPGLVSGDFSVVKGYSRNGGLLCPVD